MFFVSTSTLERDKGRRANRDEMLQSELFFAGANRTVSGGAPIPSKENGILTSYEAAQFNLEGSELVVQSACETARGQQATMAKASSDSAAPCRKPAPGPSS